MKEKQRSSLSWIAEFAGTHKKMYAGSVLAALIGVLFGIAPYFVMADMIRRLFAGDRDLHGFLMDCVVMGIFWLIRVLCHSVSTTLSHKATFHVLAAIRKRCLDKLGRMSLGAVQSKSSGELKNIIVERIDSIETTLAHILPEFTTNLATVHTKSSNEISFHHPESFC